MFKRETLKQEIMRSEILRQHGIRVVELDNGMIIADTSKEENGKVYEVSRMSDDEFWAWLGY